MASRYSFGNFYAITSVTAPAALLFEVLSRLVWVSSRTHPSPLLAPLHPQPVVVAMRMIIIVVIFHSCLFCYCRAADGLIAPHGGSLVTSMVTDKAEKEQLLKACEGRKIECSDRNACDVELLCVGGFSPLDGFMNEARSRQRFALYATKLSRTAHLAHTMVAHDCETVSDASHRS